MRYTNRSPRTEAWLNTLESMLKAVRLLFVVMIAAISGMMPLSATIIHAAPPQGPPTACTIYVPAGYYMPCKDNPNDAPPPDQGQGAKLPSTPSNAGDACTNPDVLATCPPEGGYRVYGGNPPTNVPRDEQGNILFEGTDAAGNYLYPDNPPWFNMSFGRARAEQDALWEWQHSHGYPPESVNDDLALQGWLDHLAVIAAENGAPAQPTAAPAPPQQDEQQPAPAPAPSEVPAGPSPEQCAQWQTELTTLEEKLPQAYSKLADAKKALEEAQSKEDSANSALNENLDKQQRRINELASLRRNIKTWQDQLKYANTAQRIKELIGVIAEGLARVKVLEAELQDLQAAQSGLQRKVDQAAIARSKAQDDVFKAASDVDWINSRIQVLKFSLKDCPST